MRQRYILLISLFTLLSFTASTHAQDCTGPDGDIGVVRFNVDYGVLQVCTPQSWIALHSMTCPDGDGSADPCSFEGSCSTPAPGTVCADSTIFVGPSPVEGTPMYTTASDQGVFTHGPIIAAANNANDGRANTDALIADGPHPAADACRDLGPEWYLPSINELIELSNSKDQGALDGTFATGGGLLGRRYWSSTYRSPNSVHTRDIEGGFNGNGNSQDADDNYNVRCFKQ